MNKITGIVFGLIGIGLLTFSFRLSEYAYEYGNQCCIIICGQTTNWLECFPYQCSQFLVMFSIVIFLMLGFEVLVWFIDRRKPCKKE